jgi:signal transduction histidine kinase/CheY-like chemotaxis protein
LKNEDNRTVSTKSTYLITFLLGLAFSLTLVQSAWKTAIDRKQKDFQFEIISIKQTVARNVLAGNDITNNIAAFISSNDKVIAEQFKSFSKDLLGRYTHIESINYYEYSDTDGKNTFPLIFDYSRINTGMNQGDDIYNNPKYKDAIDTAILTGSVVPAPPDSENNEDRKYWLFKAIYEKDSANIKKNDYAGIVSGMVSVLVSPTKLIGERATNSSLTITMFSDTSNLYGRQLLYYNNPNNLIHEPIWVVETLEEEELIQLPPYSIKILIKKELSITDLEYHLLLIALLIGIGIILLLYGLVRAKTQQEKELRLRNSVIEKQVEEQTHELALARDEAIEAVRMKSEFLASMSHEIRTPLNAIIGMSDLMSETSLSNEQSRYVSVFKKAGDALLSLVNDILDLSKMEAQQLVLENIPFNIIEVVEEAAEIYAQKAADKDVEIITRTYLDRNINISRVGDPGRLKQIILNLISNALKFTDEGEIIITLSGDDEKDSDNITISVSDTGIGIPRNKLESIFASFTQADTSTTRKYGGTGLGLTICKHLSQMMDGDISVESEEGKGSCFSVTISLAKQNDQSIVKNKFLDKNIYVIDTNIKSCLSLEDHIVETGANAIKITNIDDIGEIIGKGPVADAILINSEYIFSGENIAESLSGLIKLDKVILLVNPKYMSRHSRTAEKHKLNQLLIKPVKSKDLFHAMDAIINPRANDGSNNTQNDESFNDIDGKHILLVEDNPDNRLLIKAYLKKTPHSVDEAENGEVAVEMYKKKKYDLVFMDVQMPIMDGHEATRQIRSWESAENKDRTKIVSLTAHAIKEEVEKCMAAGCDTHLSKPIKKETLLKTIEKLA